MHLIDGYNLLFTGEGPWSLRGPHDLPTAVRILVSAIDRFCERRKTAALVAFDGNPTPGSPGSTARLRILFTGKGRSADDFLRELCDAVPEGEKFAPILVSSDRAVALHARAASCRVVCSEAFAKSLQAGLLGKAGASAPAPRNRRLTPSEVDAWMKEFGLS